MSNLSKGRQEAIRKERERLNEKLARNDALFDSEAFCDFLTDLANRSLYFKSLVGLTEESRAAALAIRDIVSALVVNSSRGAEWLRAYAAKAATKPKSENPNG